MKPITTTTGTAVPKPTPAQKPVQIVTRVTPTGHETIKALAEAEGLTIQQLGLYAWSLALAQYGKPPLPEVA